ncbi:hypothetical protein FB45DRAFT_886853, partial [Roridomyces roridus]
MLGLARWLPASLRLAGAVWARSVPARSKLIAGRIWTWARTGKVSRGPWASTMEPLNRANEALAGVSGNTSGSYSSHQQTGCRGYTGTTSAGWRVLG